MDISNLGEFGLIQKIKERFLVPSSEKIIGIGDDCAVIPQTPTESLLVTTDMLVEDIHFLRNDISPRDLGYKSLAVNLSDIAAMGGKPCYVFLSLALPTDLSISWLEDFFVGFHELLNTHKVLLLGGDTNKSDHGIIINVTLIGNIETQFLKTRSSAQVGDIICVTSTLGDAAGGLDIILNQRPHEAAVTPLLQRQYRPQPAVYEGRWLAQHACVHAMMDVSDGIGSDLKHILSSSSCGARIDIESLPISTSLQNLATTYNLNLLKKVIYGGEDYCLLFTVEACEFNSLNTKFQKEFQRTLYPIGKISPSTEGLRYCKENLPFSLSGHGYDHFKTETY